MNEILTDEMIAEKVIAAADKYIKEKARIVIISVVLIAAVTAATAFAAGGTGAYPVYIGFTVFAALLLVALTFAPPLINKYKIKYGKYKVEKDILIGKEHKRRYTRAGMRCFCRYTLKYYGNVDVTENSAPLYYAEATGPGDEHYAVVLDGLFKTVVAIFPCQSYVYYESPERQAGEYK